MPLLPSIVTDQNNIYLCVFCTKSIENTGGRLNDFHFEIFGVRFHANECTHKCYRWHLAFFLLVLPVSFQCVMRVARFISFSIPKPIYRVLCEWVGWRICAYRGIFARRMGRHEAAEWGLVSNFIRIRARLAQF